MIECYDAYRWSITESNENKIQAKIHYSLDYLSHIIICANSEKGKAPKWNKSIDDFEYSFKTKSTARQEFIDWNNEDD